MPTITLTVGLPGCGKTTWAVEEVRRSKSKTVNINRDDMRESMAGSHENYKFKDDNEKYIDAMQIAAADTAAKNKWNIIISDTNLKLSIRKKWKDWAKANGYDYKEKNFFDDFVAKSTSGADVHQYFKIKEFVKQCKDYNLLRYKSVPESVIDNMADSYLYSNIPIPSVQKDSMYDFSTEYIIVDIDGTLAHRGNRNPYDESTVLEDTPDLEVISSVLAEVNHHKRKVIIMSGRHETCAKDTRLWLHENGVPFEYLFMRSENDNRPDDVVKYELYMKHVAPYYNVVKVYDDRQQVCTMWRKLLKLKVFQVDFGNF